jgi:nitrogen fixation protein NifB
MQMKESPAAEALRTHPCFSEDAHRSCARIHLPVAPRCNIQCNYCNRKYDCCNESRPGVTSDVLSPEEAVERIRAVTERVPGLTVIGIAGPGDPMANEETFRTLELAGREFEGLSLCISTNGLALAENVERLWGLGVRFVTVTINAVDPAVGARIYGSVAIGGRALSGEEGAAALIERQLDAVKRAADRGMLVKVNTVMVPGVNDAHIPELVKRVRGLGAYIVNILPLIPVEGTAFAGMRAPTSEERGRLMDLCAMDARMMRHCRQCRADAVGLLGEDRSAEFRGGGCASPCGPRAGRANVAVPGGRRVAVATSDGSRVDRGFGNAERFDVYDLSGGSPQLAGEIAIDVGAETAGEAHRRHLEDVADRLGGCSAVAVREIGALPAEMLKARGVRVLVAEKGEGVPSLLKRAFE